MTPQAILADVWASGITLHVAADGDNLSAPAGRLSHEQRALIVANKAELLAFLVATKCRVGALISAAMLASNHHLDGEAARQQMLADCLATPPHLQDDLREHLVKTYGGKS